MSDDFDLSDLSKGINPKILFEDKGTSWLTKGMINRQEALQLSINMVSVLDPSDFNINIEREFTKSFMILTRSIAGLGLSTYEKTTKGRIIAEDMKTRIKVDGEQ